jgi:hypothetical protein
MAPTDTTDRFYTDLDPFERFDAFVEFDTYEAVPDDWVVMLTDVQGSTRAIEAGQYKQVNMVGAASITAVLNICGDIEVPFVFGGDGGTLVVPSSLREAAADALIRLQAASQSMFGLALRAGAIPVCELRARGRELRIRKFKLSPGNYLAMFSGGGMELADELLKDPSPDNPFVLQPSSDTGDPDLDGLSCRWEPLAPKHGCMMNLMVQARGKSAAEEGEQFKKTLQLISAILGHDLQGSAPANDHSLRFKWPPAGLKLEARATANNKPYWRVYLAALTTSLFQLWCERFNRKAGDYNAPVYREELKSNTDFRKFDGMLRAVLDVTPEQAERVEQYLEKEFQAGSLVYGVHTAETALMTCLVFNLAQSEHVHFVDGAGGGFAMAAIGFKKRLKTAP